MRTRVKPGFASLLLLAVLFIPSLACHVRPLRPLGDGGTTVHEVNADSRTVDATSGIYGQILRLIAGGKGGIGFSDGTGSSARLISPGSMASDGKGHLYFLDDDGYAIRSIDLATRQVSTIYLSNEATMLDSVDSATGKFRFNLTGGLVHDGNGNLYASSWNTIRRISVSTGKVSEFAGSLYESGSLDGVGLRARFASISGMAIDRSGTVFLTEQRGNIVRQIVLATGEVTTLAGLPEESGYADGKGEEARFNNPKGIATDGLGNLYVGDNFNRALRKVVVATREVTTLLGPRGENAEGGAAPFVNEEYAVLHPASNGANGVYLVDGTALLEVRRLDLATGQISTIVDYDGPEVGTLDWNNRGSQLSPKSILHDGKGRLFVADPPRYSIRQIDEASGTISTLAGSPERHGSSDGEGDAARFEGPLGMIADPSGPLYVADSENATIRKVEPATGKVTTIAGAPKTKGKTDGTGSAARFTRPSSLALDRRGDLIVADPPTCALRRVDVKSGEVTTLAANPGWWRSDTGSTDNAACVDIPFIIAGDQAGGLFILDSSDQTLRRLNLDTGALTFLADIPASDIASPETMVETALLYPNGIAYDGAGYVYITRAADNSILRLALATGEWTTLAGPTHTGSLRDGDYRYAVVNKPTGLAFDHAGNLLVADADNHAIRKLDVGSLRFTTLLKSPEQAYRNGLEPVPGGLVTPIGLAVGAGNELFILDRSENAVFALGQ